MPDPGSLAKRQTRRGAQSARALRSGGFAGAPVVPGYKIVRLVGKGGMGVVWEAFEHRLERKVALKVRRSGEPPELVAELWAEAKLAARIAHPGIVSVHDVGTTPDGQPYYTMDLIEGASLKAALREGPMPPARALAIGIEIADAVAAAHACGVVHCDLKPGNILLDAQGRVRILDFGIAERQGEKRERRSVLGSPPYMSPEQIAGEPPMAASDIYSIGVILYEMIAGQRPFKAESKEELLRAIQEDAPPPLSPQSPLVPAELCRVCMRCIDKRPEARLSSARALHGTLVAILEGRPLPSEEPIAPSYVPRARSRVPQRIKLPRESANYHYRFRFSFDAPPERVWPYMADTDQGARALGWQPVHASTHRAPEGHLILRGMFRVLGITFSWEDDPYAWVRHREYSNFKSHDQGPLAASWGHVSLRPIEGSSRTEVIFEMLMLMRGAVGWLLLRLPLTLLFTLRFGRYFRKIASLLAANAPPSPGFDEPPHPPSASARAHVEKAAARLTGELRFPDALVAKLSRLLLHAPDKQIERLRPFALADAWGARREEVLDLFLRAGSVGLVDVAWDLICAECRLPYEMVPSLEKVARVGACAGCGAAYEGDLASSVELIFRPHRAIREVRPQAYCVQPLGRRPHIMAQQILDPGERRALVVDLDRGSFRLIATRAARAWDFEVSAVGSSGACTLRLTPEAIEAQPRVVRAGEIAIEIENATEREEVFRLEAVGDAGDRVTAAVALNHPSFHAFFSEEFIAHGEHLSVSRMAFLFVDVADREALVREHGDAGALQILCKLNERVREEVEAQQGRVVQADAAVGVLVAAFPDGALAVRAALRRSARARDIEPNAKVRAAVHQGRCIALTRDHQIQYFGETVERGVALLAEGGPGCIAVSTEVFCDRDAARVILEEDVDGLVLVT